MDFHGMKRKQLQALCKNHGVPANLTNREMAERLDLILKGNDLNEEPISGEIASDNDAKVVRKQVKKVRFSPENQTFYFEVSAFRKPGKRRPTKKSLPKRKAQGIESAGKSEDSNEPVGSPVWISRSRAQKAVEGDLELVFSPPGEKKRKRRAKASRCTGVENVLSNRTGNDNVSDKPHLLDEISEDSSIAEDNVKPKNLPKRTRRNARKENPSTSGGAVGEVEVVAKNRRSLLRARSENEDSKANIEVKTVSVSEESKDALQLEEPLKVLGRSSLRRKPAAPVMGRVESNVFDGDVSGAEKGLRRSRRNAVNNNGPELLKRDSRKTGNGGRIASLQADQSEVQVPKVQEESEVVTQPEEMLKGSSRYVSRAKSVVPQKGKVENDGEVNQETRKQARNTDLDSLVETANQIERPKKASVSLQEPYRKTRSSTVILSTTSSATELDSKVKQMRELHPEKDVPLTKELPRRYTRSSRYHSEATSNEDETAAIQKTSGLKQQKQEAILEEETSVIESVSVTENPLKRSARNSSIKALVAPAGPTVKAVKKKQDRRPQVAVVEEEPQLAESLSAPLELPEMFPDKVVHVTKEVSRRFTRNTSRQSSVATSNADKITVVQKTRRLKEKRQEPYLVEDTSVTVSVTEKPLRRSTRSSSINISVAPAAPNIKAVKEQGSRPIMATVEEEPPFAESLPASIELPDILTHKEVHVTQFPRRSTRNSSRNSSTVVTSNEETAVAEKAGRLNQQMQEPIMQEETSVAESNSIIEKPLRRSNRNASISTVVAGAGPSVKAVKKKQESRPTIRTVKEGPSFSKSFSAAKELPECPEKEAPVAKEFSRRLTRNSSRHNSVTTSNEDETAAVKKSRGLKQQRQKPVLEEDPSVIESVSVTENPLKRSTPNSSLNTSDASAVKAIKKNQESGPSVAIIEEESPLCKSSAPIKLSAVDDGYGVPGGTKEENELDMNTSKQAVEKIDGCSKKKGSGPRRNSEAKKQPGSAKASDLVLDKEGCKGFNVNVVDTPVPKSVKLAGLSTEQEIQQHIHKSTVFYEESSTKGDDQSDNTKDKVDFLSCRSMDKKSGLNIANFGEPKSVESQRNNNHADSSEVTSTVDGFSSANQPDQAGDRSYVLEKGSSTYEDANIGNVNDGDEKTNVKEDKKLVELEDANVATAEIIPGEIIKDHQIKRSESSRSRIESEVSLHKTEEILAVDSSVGEEGTKIKEIAIANSSIGIKAMEENVAGSHVTAEIDREKNTEIQRSMIDTAMPDLFKSATESQAVDTIWRPEIAFSNTSNGMCDKENNEEHVKQGNMASAHESTFVNEESSLAEYDIEMPVEDVNVDGEIDHIDYANLVAEFESKDKNMVCSKISSHANGSLVPDQRDSAELKKGLETEKLSRDENFHSTSDNMDGEASKAPIEDDQILMQLEDANFIADEPVTNAIIKDHPNELDGNSGLNGASPSPVKKQEEVNATDSTDGGRLTQETSANATEEEENAAESHLVITTTRTENFVEIHYSTNTLKPKPESEVEDMMHGGKTAFSNVECGISNQENEDFRQRDKHSAPVSTVKCSEETTVPSDAKETLIQDVAVQDELNHQSCQTIDDDHLVEPKVIELKNECSNLSEPKKVLEREETSTRENLNVAFDKMEVEDVKSSLLEVKDLTQLGDAISNTPEFFQELIVGNFMNEPAGSDVSRRKSDIVLKNAEEISANDYFCRQGIAQTGSFVEFSGKRLTTARCKLITPGTGKENITGKEWSVNEHNDPVATRFPPELQSQGEPSNLLDQDRLSEREETSISEGMTCDKVLAPVKDVNNLMLLEDSAMTTSEQFQEIIEAAASNPECGICNEQKKEEVQIEENEGREALNNEKASLVAHEEISRECSEGKFLVDGILLPSGNTNSQVAEDKNNEVLDRSFNNTFGETQETLLHELTREGISPVLSEDRDNVIVENASTADGSVKAACISDRKLSGGCLTVSENMQEQIEEICVNGSSIKYNLGDETADSCQFASEQLKDGKDNANQVAENEVGIKAGSVSNGVHLVKLTALCSQLVPEKFENPEVLIGDSNCKICSATMNINEIDSNGEVDVRQHDHIMEDDAESALKVQPADHSDWKVAAYVSESEMSSIKTTFRESVAVVSSKFPDKMAHVSIGTMTQLEEASHRDVDDQGKSIVAELEFTEISSELVPEKLENPEVQIGDRSCSRNIIVDNPLTKDCSATMDNNELDSNGEFDVRQHVHVMEENAESALKVQPDDHSDSKAAADVLESETSSETTFQENVAVVSTELPDKLSHLSIETTLQFEEATHGDVDDQREAILAELQQTALSSELPPEKLENPEVLIGDRNCSSKIIVNNPLSEDCIPTININEIDSNGEDIRQHDHVMEENAESAMKVQSDSHGDCKVAADVCESETSSIETSFRGNAAILSTEFQDKMSHVCIGNTLQEEIHGNVGEKREAIEAELDCGTSISIDCVTPTVCTDMDNKPIFGPRESNLDIIISEKGTMVKDSEGCKIDRNGLLDHVPTNINKSADESHTVVGEISVPEYGEMVHVSHHRSLRACKQKEKNSIDEKSHADDSYSQPEIGLGSCIFSYLNDPVYRKEDEPHAPETKEPQALLGNNVVPIAKDSRDVGRCESLVEPQPEMIIDLHAVSAASTTPHENKLLKYLDESDIFTGLKNLFWEDVDSVEPKNSTANTPETKLITEYSQKMKEKVIIEEIAAQAAEGQLVGHLHQIDAEVADLLCTHAAASYDSNCIDDRSLKMENDIFNIIQKSIGHENDKSIEVKCSDVSSYEMNLEEFSKVDGCNHDASDNPVTLLLSRDSQEDCLTRRNVEDVKFSVERDKRENVEEQLRKDASGLDAAAADQSPTSTIPIIADVAFEESIMGQPNLVSSQHKNLNAEGSNAFYAKQFSSLTGRKSKTGLAQKMPKKLQMHNMKENVQSSKWEQTGSVTEPKSSRPKRQALADVRKY